MRLVRQKKRPIRDVFASEISIANLGHLHCYFNVSDLGSEIRLVWFQPVA